MKVKTEISVIIVNYNSPKNTLSCINSLLNSKKSYSFEIIVVDNSENSELKKYLKGKHEYINYIKSKINGGYGAGNNIGVKASKGKYVMILNPDCIVKPNTLKILADFLNNNKIAGAVAPNLIDQKGKVFSQLGSRELTPMRGIFALSFLNKIFPKNPISKSYYLFNKSPNHLREVDAVPGSAFMIRKDVFEKAGGFDENIFLFFEESDLGRRVRKFGYKLFINPKTSVVHNWRIDKKNKTLQKTFNDSRFYYFKKHFGILNALIVEAICRISLYDLIFFILLIVGAFLMFYRSQYTMSFDSELANVYLEIKNYITKGVIPLVGPSTSHPWLRFGPLYYWIMIPVFYIARYNPLTISYFMKIISLLIAVFNYYFIKKLLDRNTALISTLLIVISPTLIFLSNTSMLYSFVPILFYPFLYLFIKFKGSSFEYFLILFLFSIILNFHLSALVYLPFIIFFLIVKRRYFNLRKLLLSFTAFMLPFITVIIYDSQQNFEMTKNFLLWIPYRLIGFLGIIPNNRVSTDVFNSNLYTFYKYITKLFVIGSGYLNIFIFLIFVFSLVIVVKHIFLKRDLNTIVLNTQKVLVLILLFGYLGIFIHGNPPEHYYLPLYPIPFILIAISVKYIGKLYRYVLLFSFILILINNISLLFSYRWFYIPIFNYNKYHILYETQEKIVNFIIDDSHGMPISIRRTGINNQYQNEFAANYQYLLWMHGNEPVRVGNLEVNQDEKPVYEYRIIEIYDENTLSKLDNVMNINGVYLKRTAL